MRRYVLQPSFDHLSSERNNVALVAETLLTDLQSPSTGISLGLAALAFGPHGGPIGLCPHR